MHRIRRAITPSTLALAFALSWNPAILGAEGAPPSPTTERHPVVVRIRDPHNGARILPFGKGYLGIELIELTPELLDHFDVKAGHGIMISRIEPGSPADKAGLVVGDVVTGIDGTTIDSAWEVQRKIRGKDAGETASVEFWRKGKLQTLTVTIAERKRAEMDLAPLFLKRRDGKDVVIEIDRERLGRSRERVVGPLAHERGPSRRPREAELENRMKELEKRIAELERLLEKR